SLSYSCLAQAKILVFLAIGTNKNAALKKIVEELFIDEEEFNHRNKRSPVSLICRQACSDQSKIYFLADTSAAKQITAFKQ
ncbi:MAG: hypothetical protein MK193_15470, partial [Lentisphaeria bacterium]|nr:hypothetical protein [Lentisphaeria bacterium]